MVENGEFRSNATMLSDWRVDQHRLAVHYSNL